MARSSWGKTVTKNERYKWPEVERTEIVMVDKNLIKIDESYQRGLAKARAQDIARDFNWALFGAVIVSKRPDGTLWCIDGQHRLTAAKMREEIINIPCHIKEYEGTAEEAEFFVSANRMRKPIRAIDAYRAAVVAGDRDAVEIRRILGSFGYRVSSAVSQGCTKCVSLLMKMIKADASMALKTIEFCCSSANGEHLNNAFVAGSFYLAKVLPEALSEESSKRLRNMGMGDVLKRIKNAVIEVGQVGGRSNNPRSCALGILNAINYRSTKKIDASKLLLKQD